MEIVTDASVKLLEAIDSNNGYEIRKCATAFKNAFFALWFRTKSILMRSNQDKTGLERMENFVKATMMTTHPDAYKLLSEWSAFCDILNESGLTDVPLPESMKSFMA